MGTPWASTLHQAFRTPARVAKHCSVLKPRDISGSHLLPEVWAGPRLRPAFTPGGWRIQKFLSLP